MIEIIGPRNISRAAAHFIGRAISLLTRPRADQSMESRIARVSVAFKATSLKSQALETEPEIDALREIVRVARGLAANAPEDPEFRRLNLACDPYRELRELSAEIDRASPRPHAIVTGKAGAGKSILVNSMVPNAQRTEAA